MLEHAPQVGVGLVDHGHVVGRAGLRQLDHEPLEPDADEDRETLWRDGELRQVGGEHGADRIFEQARGVFVEAGSPIEHRGIAVRQRAQDGGGSAPKLPDVLPHRVERLEGAPRFVDGKYLVRSELHGQLRDIEGVAGFEPKALQVDLRVRPSTKAREIKAVLVPWEQLDSLRRMIYAIPPSALAHASVAPLIPGLLVVASRPGARTQHTGVDLGAVLPLGRRFVEAGPGVLVPEGFELWPRVRPKLARELMGLSSDDIAIFLDASASPARIDANALQALDAASVARFVPESAAVTSDALPALESGQIVNETLPRFALWGFRGRAEE